MISIKRIHSKRDTRKRNQKPTAFLLEDLELRLLLDADPLLEFAVFGQEELKIDEHLIATSGDIGSDGKVEVKTNSELINVLAGEIKLDQNVFVSGFLLSNGKVEIKQDSSVVGNIDAAQEVKLEDAVQVQGNVTSADEVQLGQGVNVVGTITEFGTPTQYTSIALPTATTFAFDPNNDIDRGKNQTTTLVAGVYGELKLDDGNTLNLSAGEYFFESIDIKKNLQFLIDVSAGDVQIFVDEKVSFDEHLDVTLIGGDASDVYLETLDEFEMKEGGEWFGTIYAPLGDIKFEENSTIVGAAYSGKKVELQKNSRITLVPSDYLGGDIEPPEVVVQLLNDTGDPTDNVTSDPAVSGTVTDSGSVTSLTLVIPELSAAVYDLTSEVGLDGAFTLDKAQLETRIGAPPQDGNYTFVFVATDDAGNVSTPLDVTLSLDSTAPGQPTIDGVADDTGVSDADGITNDIMPVLYGVAEPNSLITLSEDFIGDIGTTNTDASGAWFMGVSSMLFSAGPLTFSVTATDTPGNVSPTSNSFVVVVDDVAPAPPVITGISKDSGSDSSDGITNETTLQVSGSAEPGSNVNLIVGTLGSLGTTVADAAGDWTIDAASTVLADGSYALTSTSTDVAGNVSSVSVVFTLVIDTSPPLIRAFDLDLDSDTGELGDGRTTLEVVSLSGVTDPGATVSLVDTAAMTVSAADGSFEFGGVDLEYGRQRFSLEVIDAAGNTATSITDITYDFSVSLSESTPLVMETEFLVNLSQNKGTRTISFDVDAVFDTSDTTTALEDTLLIYLVDPNAPNQTVLDRGELGTSLFALSGDGNADYPAGLVNYDGTTVQIDVTSVDLTAAQLLVQLINADTDDGTTVTLGGISNTLAPEDIENPLFNRRITVEDPAGSVDLTSLAASTDTEFDIRNIRLDSQTGRFTAEFAVRNLGSDVGRNLVVAFPNLPSGVTLLNASGFDGAGSPYVNMFNAILQGGLATGDSTYPVLLDFEDPNLVRFTLTPTVLVSGRNTGPSVDPIIPIHLFPGDHFARQLTSTDSDGDRVTYSIETAGNLPTGLLRADGTLIFTPTPEEIGVYDFAVIATDGASQTRTPVTVTVQVDPITTTRVSGVVLNTQSQPLAGVPVELGTHQTLTQADGSFTLVLTSALDPDDALIVRGEAISGPEAYPFIAEKLPLLIGHNGFENFNNIIERPIYLPALDVGNGSAIDPLADVTVSTPLITGASVFIAAGSLEDQTGNPFTGVLSITEVPVDLTPAALPPDMFPDVVVTIQPGEMVFTTPAPLALPNTLGVLPGTMLELMSINPDTGLFDNVGTGQVSADGSVIETVSGGINNSSWHYFNAAGPTPNNPENDPRNQDKNCSDNCESRDSPDTDNQPKDNRPKEKRPDAHPPGSSPTTDPYVPEPLVDTVQPGSSSPGPPLTTSGGTHSGGGGGQRMTFKSDMFDPPQEPGPAPGNTSASNATPDTGNSEVNRRGMYALPSHRIDGSYSSVSPETEVALHSGAFYKSHGLVPYESLQIWRGLELVYDSERADPRPIIHTSFSNVGNNLPAVNLISKLVVKRGNFTYEVPGYPGDLTGNLTGGEHFFNVPTGATSLDVALQADMRTQPSGLYTYESTNRFGLAVAQSRGTAATVATDDFVHVNTIYSPFGAGWGLSGLLEIVENPDGSVLLIDGAGGELLYGAPDPSEQTFASPPGDFTTLELLGAGTYRRTHTDQKVEDFNANRQLSLVTDRNGNQTQFIYNAVGIERIIDPVGLETVFRYTGEHVTEIEDPAGRVTTLEHANGNLLSIEDPDTSQRHFEYDNQHRLTGEIDKNQNVERTVYDFAGRVTEVVRKDGSRIAYSPVQTQGLARPEDTSQPSPLAEAPVLEGDATSAVVDANGNVSTQVLDKQGQLQNASDGAGRLPSVERDQEENLVRIFEDGRGNATLYDYDDRGNVISISDVISRGGSAGPLFAGIIHAVDNHPIQVVTGDMNSDGFPDAAVASQSGDSVSVLLGDGAGGFGFRTDYTVNDPRSLRLVDIDGDRFDDIVTGNRDGTVSVLMANNDGTFGVAASFPAGSEINFVETTDLNGDGLIDIVAADYNDEAVVTLLGTGGGSFGSPTSFSIGARPASVAVGDFNRDSVPDVVAANIFTSNISLLFGVGDGSLGATTILPVGGSTTSVKVGDVTGDGELDIVATDGAVDVSVLPGNGDGTFATEVRYDLIGNSGGGTFPPYNSAIEIVDVDRDRDLDLVVAEGIDVVTVLTNDGNGVFAITDSFAGLDESVSVASADLNLDGFVDVVVLGNDSQSIVGVIGNGNGTFVDPLESQPDIAIGDRPIALDTVDLNNDGHLDVVTANQTDETVTVLLGDGAGGMTISGTFPAGSVTLHVSGADLDGDGNIDLVAANYSTDSLSILLGDGTGNFAAPVNLPAGPGPSEVVLADLDGDTDLDIVSAGNRNGASQFSVLLNNGDATFAPAMNTDVGFDASSPDLADINNDGFLDLAVANASSAFSNRVNVRLGNGDGTFQTGVEWGIGGSGFFPGPPSQVKLGDVTGDGFADIIATDTSSDQVIVRPGLGNGAFGNVLAINVADAPSSLDLGDVDGDRNTDIIVANQNSHRVSVLLGQGDGSFGERADFSVGSRPSWVELADLNEDGQLDFVVTNRDSDSLTVRLNTGQFSSQVGKTIEYDPTFSRMTRTLDEEGRVVLFEVDPTNGNRLSMTRVIGDVGGGDDVVTQYTYTPEGLVNLIIDPLGRVTDSDYDALGRLTRVTYAVGTPDEASEQFEYDLVGLLTASIDELGHRTEFAYDEMNRMSTIVEADPDGAGPLLSPVTTYTYDAHGNLTVKTDALQHAQNYVYDDQHRVIEAIDDDGEKILYTYDNSGNVTSVVDRLGRETKFVYDDRNRMFERINALGGYEERLYDLDDNLLQVVDENQNATRYSFDARNRLERVVDAIGGVVGYEYDRVNHLTAMEDELFRRTEMTYDQLDRNLSITLPDPDKEGPDSSPTTRFVYDKASNLVGSTDALGNVTALEYDARDRLVKQTDADPDGDSGPLLSPISEFTYDVANRLVSVGDPLQRVTTFVYDDLDRLIEETFPDPDGLAGPETAPVMTYTYDAEDHQTSIADALGNFTQFEYDNLYRLIRIINEDPDGPVGPESNPITVFTYDEEDQLLATSDPLNRVTTYGYDALGRLSAEIYPDPDGSTGPEASPVMTYAYDNVGNETSMTDALGITTVYEYDDIYRTTRVVEEDPDGPIGPRTNPVTTYQFDAAHQTTAIVDPLLRITEFEYDELGRVIREIYPDPDGPAGSDGSPVMHYVYDLMNNELSMTDALGNATEYRYDNLYRLTSIIEEDPDGPTGPQTNPTTNFDYDIASQMTATTDPLGRITTHEYDELGRVVREIYPDPDGSAGPLAAPEMTYSFDLMDNKLSMTDAVGNMTQYVYDNLYRLVRLIEEDPDGAGPMSNPVSQFNYDVADQLLSESDPLDRKTTHAYDDLGRVVLTTRPDPDGAGPLASPQMSYSYDLMNNKLSMTDPLGHRTQYEYDSLYRVVRQIEEDLDGAGPLTHPTTEFDYDLVDNLLSFTDPVGNRTEYAYDDLDRLATETIELGLGNFASRESVYDLENNLIQRTDRNGRVVEYDYDNIYRLVEERWLDDSSTVINTIQFDFDEASQLLRAEDVTIGSRHDYIYDGLSRVTQTFVNNGGLIVAFANAYDSQSRRTERGATVAGVADYLNTYDYDGLNRLARTDQADQGGSVVTAKRFDFAYNADDQLTLISRYNDIGGLTSDLVFQSTYDHDGIGRLVDTVHANDTSTIVDYDWTFDVASRITQFNSSIDGASDYSYDNGDQLTGTTHASQQDEAYDYDENGNRTSTGYSTGFYNRLTSNGTFDYEYDAEGNRTKRTNIATGEVTDYEWDHRDRLVAVIERDSEGDLATKTISHRYDVFDRWISREIDSDGAGAAVPEVTRYQYDGTNIVLQMDDSNGVTNRYVWGPLVDQILADEQIGDDVYWPAVDHLGTVRDLVNSSGNAVNHIIYDSFGNITNETDGSIDHFFGYTGRAFDSATGLQNNLNRWYDAEVGRWTSEDPMGFEAGDPNPFRYVRNNAIRAIDPHGLAELTVRKIQDALPYAKLAESAYTSAGMADGQMVGDYRVKRVFDEEAGFRAVWFENTTTGDAVLSFAGTETPSLMEGVVDLVGSSARAAGHALRGHSGDEIPRDLFQTWGDWLADIHQGGGGVNNVQYEKAISVTGRLKDIYGDKLTLTGHSLGGGLASAGAIVNGVPATVFNPAGVHPTTLSNHGASYADAGKLIDTFRAWADPLTALQDRLPGMPDTSGTIFEIPTTDNGLLYWLNNHGMSRLAEMMKRLIGNGPTGGGRGRSGGSGGSGGMSGGGSNWSDTRACIK